MSRYLGDPGGIFESDYHRRVVGHLPKPDEDLVNLSYLWARLYVHDIGTNIEAESELEAILEELINGGHVEKDGYGYRMTKAGLAALCAPHPDPKQNEPMEGDRLKRAEAFDAELAAEDAKSIKEAAEEAAKVAMEDAEEKAKEAAAL